MKNTASRLSIGDRIPNRENAILSILAGSAGVAGSFAVAGFTPSFIVGAIAGMLARVLPAPIITFAIVVLGDLGEQLNVVAAFFIAISLLAITSEVGYAIADRGNNPRFGPPIAGVLGALSTWLVSGALTASLAAGAAVTIVLAIAIIVSTLRTPLPLSEQRRRVLGGTITALALITGSGIIGTRHSRSRQTDLASLSLPLPQSIRRDITASLADAAEKSLAVSGLEPLVSEEFYQVDINAADPVIDVAEWELTVTGAVTEETAYTYTDILDRPPQNRFITLRCVGEQLNGKKMDNALWTGLPIMSLVEPAVPQESCCVMLRAADGFYEEFPLAALENGFLAYAMNGDPLPRGHGYPVRALIPGHWGEINVKWLTEIELLEEEQDGYWEERGWHGTGPVNTVAKLHVVNHLEDGRIQVGGHAYAGTRGIDRVEVSIDGGSSWHDAQLSAPLPGDDVWRQWEYTYNPPVSAHEVVVRATDGTGALQPRTEALPFPNGPSGWVSRTVKL